LDFIEVRIRGEVPLDVNSDYLSFGDKRIDSSLCIERGTMTMFFGPPFTGKTSFCLSASITEAMKGHQVMYLDSESGVSPIRVKKMLSARGLDIDGIKGHFKLLRTRSLREILGYAGYAIKNGFGLVVIDSISRPYLIETRRGKEDEIEMDLYNALVELQEEAIDEGTTILIVSEVRRRRDISRLEEFDPHDFLFLDNTPWPITTLGSLAKNAVGLIIVRNRRFAFIERHLSKPSIYEDTKYIEFEITDSGVKYISDVELNGSSISYRIVLD